VIIIKKIITGKWKENCFIIYNSAKDALVIDPGGKINEIVHFIEDNDLKILAILNTHAHYDHIGAVYELKETFSIPFYLHSKDQKLLKSANLYRMIFEGDKVIKIPKIDFYFDLINTPIHLGGFSIDILFTPGHTEGGVCIIIEDSVFTGDTLFAGKIGRTDLPGGNHQTLMKSLKVFSQLPHEFNIFPGHGKITTIADELTNNKILSEVLKSAQ
jgi:hydroxyacylglutathione hydrolase